MIEMRLFFYLIMPLSFIGFSCQKNGEARNGIKEKVDLIVKHNIENIDAYIEYLNGSINGMHKTKTKIYPKYLELKIEDDPGNPNYLESVMFVWGRPIKGNKIITYEELIYENNTIYLFVYSELIDLNKSEKNSLTGELLSNNLMHENLIEFSIKDGEINNYGSFHYFFCKNDLSKIQLIKTRDLADKEKLSRYFCE